MNTRYFAAIPRPSILALLSALVVAYAASAAPPPSDGAITRAVERAFFEDPVVRGSDITVQTRRGIVKLAGWVDSRLAQERAARIVHRIPGARAVMNDIEIRARPGLNDAAIGEAVERALIAVPATASADVEVSVTGGTVQLQGEVESWQTRQVAEQTAKGVTGVRAVQNAITVAGATARTDLEILREVEAALKLDVAVDAKNIEVLVDAGRVMLQGQVDTPEEKQRARRLAFVLGVHDVDVQGLQVSGAEQVPAAAFEVPDEQSIRKAVVDALALRPELADSNIEVTVQGRVVFLQGRVATAAESRLAAETAMGVTGVWTVRNRLRVPAQPG